MIHTLCTAAALLLASLIPTAARADGPGDPPVYPTAHDAPLHATETATGTTRNVRSLRVEFDGVRRDRVPAFLYLPRDQRRTHPAVLLQYGRGGSKSTPYIVALGQRYAALGFVVLTIDVPLRGERAPAQRFTWRGFFQQTGTFPWTLGDYSRAVDYLLTRPEVDPNRVGYVGISWGAITGITFVAHDERVKAMASVVGGGNFLGSLHVQTPPDLKQLEQEMDPVYQVARIAPRPLLLLNATRDQLVPHFYAEALHEAAGENAKKVWLDIDHFFRGPDSSKVFGLVLEFMEENLTGK